MFTIEASHLESQQDDVLEMKPVSKLKSPNKLNKFIMPIALAAMTALTPACNKSKTDNKPDITLPAREENKMWDNNTEYFRKVEKGKF